MRDIETIISEFIATEIELWEIFDCKNIELWEEFCDDFEGFTEEEFSLTSNNRQLRDVLRKHGVWVKKGISIAETLYKTLQGWTDWTEDEILRCHHEDEEFTSNQIRCEFFILPSTDSNAWKSASSAERRQELFASRAATKKAIKAYRIKLSNAAFSASPSAPLPTPPSAPSKILKLSAFLPAPALAPSAAPLAAPLQTDQPTPSPPEKADQNQPAPHQQSSVQQTPPHPSQSSQLPTPPTYVATSGTATLFKTPTSPQTTAPFINPTSPPHTATLHVQSFYISDCTFYKKGMG